MRLKKGKDLAYGQSDLEAKVWLAESARLVFCMTASALLYALLSWVISVIWHPDVSGAIMQAKEILPVGMHGNIRPEPLEKLLYGLSLVYFPFSLLGFYWLSESPRWAFSEWFRKESCARRTIWGGLLFWIVVAIWVFAAPNPTFGSGLLLSDKQETCFGAYFTTMSILERPWVYLLFFPLCLGVFYAVFREREKKGFRYLRYVAELLVYIAAIFLFVFIVRINTTDFPESWQGQYDMNAVYYAQTQVYAGVPLYVDDFIDTYGAYPHFLNPIFHLTGLTVHNFTLVMSLLIVLSFSFLYVALHLSVKNRLLAVLGLVTLIFLPYVSTHSQSAEGYDSYFAAFPIRTVFPFLSILFSALYAYRVKFRKVVYWLAMLLLPLGILWSPDMGMVAFAAWVLFLLYKDFYDSEGRLAWKKEIMHIAAAIGGFLLSWGLYAVWIRLSFGHWPEFSLLLSTVRAFSVGFYTLAMQLRHPWIVVALMAVAAMGFCMMRLYRRQVRASDAFLMMLVFLFFGSFAYFQGRSHNANLCLPACYALLILVVLADKLGQKIEKGAKFYWIPFVPMLFVLFFPTVEAYAKIPVLKELSKPYHGKQAPQDKFRIEANKAFMDRCLERGELSAVLTSNKFQAFYFDGRKRPSGLNPGMLEVLSQSAADHQMEVLKQSEFPIFLDYTYFYYGDKADIRAAVAARYQVQSFNGNRFSWLKLREEQMLPSIFEPDANTVLYRKYSDDTAGVDDRLRDAKGVALPATGDTLCAEIVFFNTVQHYQAALLSTMKEDSGMSVFVVSDVRPDASGQLFCRNYLQVFRGKENVQTSVLPLNTWCYLAVQMAGNTLRVFCNGEILSETKMEKAIYIYRKIRGVILGIM